LRISDPWRLIPGNRFAGLLVKGLLGEGTMGCAYLASHPTLKTPLVIKTFKSTLDSQMFKEAILAARINSQNVVGVVDAGAEDGVAFVVQRYVDGIDLNELIEWACKNKSLLPRNIVCRMLIDAARGLHCIHQAGVVHRDVKPANLFLRGNGDTTVGDFGVALDISREPSAPVIAGTPMHMAPEQWSGESVDRCADIYSLGSTGHLLATGEPIFRISESSQWMAAHRDQPYVPPVAREPDAAYLFSVLEKMLRKRPETRYATGEGVARDLTLIAKPGPQLVCTAWNAAQIGPVHLTLQVGDIARSEADVIVCAANAQLTMDLGVARALRAAGGESIQREAKAYNPASMGDVVWTSAGKLRATWVAHAVAALDGAICLQRCTLRVLLGAEMRKADSVVFPALGAGVGEVPMELAATLTLEAIRTFAALAPRCARIIRIVLRHDAALERWRTIIQSMSHHEPGFTWRNYS
jgi:O-acetyl-ADP-ribose deacetylase (regulator of RNase III)